MTEDPRKIRISDYHYHLPPEAIAQFPLEERDRSRLLIMQEGKISSGSFRDLPSFLPDKSLLVLNETKVVRARVLFRKPTGAEIEILLMDPVEPMAELSQAFSQVSPVTWHGMVGNARRWHSGSLEVSTQSPAGRVVLNAEKIVAGNGEYFIRLSWTPAKIPLAEILEIFGRVPLPPYISRDPVPEDASRYQTVFAKHEGSVAAPTAGLHFTPAILEDLHGKGIDQAKLTLHVGAGTFKPVSAARIGDHEMHSEQIGIPRITIEKLLNHQGWITAVGTTTVRALESLYWQGVKWMEENDPEPVIRIGQWDPYGYPGSSAPPLDQSLEKVLSVLAKHRLDSLQGSTSLIIAPGYAYRIPSAIITNFHQPQSTLLLLVAAFVGEDWKRAYRFALDHNFRFLSYGDSCLFIRHPGF